MILYCQTSLHAFIHLYTYTVNNNIMIFILASCFCIITIIMYYNYMYIIIQVFGIFDDVIIHSRLIPYYKQTGSYFHMSTLHLFEPHHQLYPLNNRIIIKCFIKYVLNFIILSYMYACTCTCIRTSCTCMYFNPYRT